MPTPQKRGALIAKWLADRRTQEEEALIAEAMHRTTTTGTPRLLPPQPFEAFDAPLPGALPTETPPRSLEIGTPRMISAEPQRFHNVAKASSAGDDDGPYWTTRSKKWARIAAGRATPRAFERIPDEFNEIRVRAFVLNPCSGDVPVCGGGTVQLLWRGQLADMFTVTSGYTETKFWTLGRDSYTGGGFEVRFDFIGVGDYEIDGRY